MGTWIKTELLLPHNKPLKVVVEDVEVEGSGERDFQFGARWSTEKVVYIDGIEHLAVEPTLTYHQTLEEAANYWQAVFESRAKEAKEKMVNELNTLEEFKRAFREKNKLIIFSIWIKKLIYSFKSSNN